MLIYRNCFRDSTTYTFGISISILRWNEAGISPVSSILLKQSNIYYANSGFKYLYIPGFKELGPADF